MKNHIQHRLELALGFFSNGLEILDELGMKSTKQRIEEVTLELDSYVNDTDPTNVLSLVKDWQPDPMSPEYDGDPIQDDIAMLVVKNALEQLDKKEIMKEYKEINNDKS
tara:strand:- start:337 stop:663 length:327 start_codon:yes stop_codon:yes gene_type:complete